MFFYRTINERLLSTVVKVGFTAEEEVEIYENPLLYQKKAIMLTVFVFHYVAVHKELLTQQLNQEVDTLTSILEYNHVFLCSFNGVRVSCVYLLLIPEIYHGQTITLLKVFELQTLIHVLRIRDIHGRVYHVSLVL